MSKLSDSEVLFYYEIAIALGDDISLKDLKKELVKRGLNE